jgi:hypothetical protein
MLHRAPDVAGRARVRLTVVVMALLAAALLLWKPGAGGEPSVTTGGEPVVAQPLAAETPPLAAAREAQSAPQTATPVAALPPPASADELRAALRRLARTDMQDEAALEAALRPLLVPPANVYAVLELSKAGGLADGARLSEEELGALRCLALAVLVFNPVPGATSTLAAEGVHTDGRQLVLAILRALPDILSPVRELLADLLSGQVNERGERLLDLGFAAELERLAAAHPEHAELYHALLAGLLELEDGELAALRALYAQDVDSPTLVAAALSRWLAEHPESALVWAAELYDREDASAELRAAVTSAVARAAPVDVASRFLTERAQRTMLVEFLNVGEREGGLAALDQEYWQLRVSGDADERARTMLVSGMTDADTETLLALAWEDPSEAVRAQAWTTLTAAKGFVPTQATLERLREARASAGDPLLRVPSYGLISAAGSLASKARESAPELVQGALEILRSIALDRSEPERVRQQALDKLSRFVSNEEIESLRRQW